MQGAVIYGPGDADRLRVPLADGTLVATPEVPPSELIPGLLAASDVLGTGWFAADAAEAGPGKTVAVVAASARRAPRRCTCSCTSRWWALGTFEFNIGLVRA